MLKSEPSLRDVNCVKVCENETNENCTLKKIMREMNFCMNMMCLKAATSERNYRNGGRK